MIKLPNLYAALLLLIWPASVYVSLAAQFYDGGVHPILVLQCLFFILFITILVSNFRKVVVNFALFFLVAVFLKWAFHVDERIILGEKLAEVRKAEAPGYCYVEFYSHKYCRIGWGGMFGDTHRFVVPYQVDSGSLHINFYHSLNEIQGEKVDLEGENYSITLHKKRW